MVTPQQLKLDVARTPNRFAAVNFALNQERSGTGFDRGLLGPSRILGTTALVDIACGLDFLKSLDQSISLSLY